MIYVQGTWKVHETKPTTGSLSQYTGWKEIYAIISLERCAKSREAISRCIDAFELPIYEVLFHVPFTPIHVSRHRSQHVLYVTPISHNAEPVELSAVIHLCNDSCERLGCDFANIRV